MVKTTDTMYCKTAKQVEQMGEKGGDLANIY
jgi:hypothetical protein